MLKTIKLIALSSSAILLAACGGGSTSSSVALLLSPSDIDVPSNVATGTDDIDAAASFPLLYSLNVSGGDQATLQTGAGEVVVLDANNITVALEAGEAPTALTSIGGGQYQGTVDGETITIDFSKGSGTVLAFLDADPSDFGFTGIFGFETPASQLPSGTAVYENAGLARAYVATSGDTDVLQVVQDGAANPSLTVEFGTGNVSGTLFDGTAQVDLADDGTADDTLNLQVDIANGSISGGILSGEVSLVATVDVNGGALTDLDPNVSSSSVDGRVFGFNGNVVGGTFEAVADLDIGESERVEGAVAGTFFTVN